MENLRRNDKKQINEWIGGSKQYRLLYKASINGCSAKAFHDNCDGKGETVTVLYNTDKTVYGGYTSFSWDKSGMYKNDCDAFLFRLYQDGIWKPVQMKVKNSKNAIFCEKSYGPTFGGEDFLIFKTVHDLHTFSGTIQLDGTYYPLNGSAKFGTSYRIDKENYKSIANGHLKVKDIEVYLLQDAKEPWTCQPAWNKKGSYVVNTGSSVFVTDVLWYFDNPQDFPRVNCRRHRPKNIEQTTLDIYGYTFD